jgi:hypothetical protein
MQEATIFLGAIPGVARDYLAKLLADAKAERIFNPCAGRFSGIAAAIAAGVPAERIDASDISLFSSLIGFLADPTKKFEDLGIAFAEEVPGLRDNVDIAAHAMLVLKFEQLSTVTQHGLNLRLQMRASWAEFRAKIRDAIDVLVRSIHGFGTAYIPKELAEVLRAAVDREDLPRKDRWQALDRWVKRATKPASGKAA